MILKEKEKLRTMLSNTINRFFETDVDINNIVEKDIKDIKMLRLIIDDWVYEEDK